MSEQDAPVETANPVVLDWLSKFSKAASTGFEAIRTLQNLGQDFADSAELQAMAPKDFVNAFAGLSPADVMAALAAVQAIGETADGEVDGVAGARRKAVKKFAFRGH